MIVDLYSGSGGWAYGLHLTGVDPAQTLGIEWDESAAATHTAAGFPTLVADVASLDPREYGPITGLLGSPPCQPFSSAGKGKGLDVIGLLLQHVEACMDGWVDPPETICTDDLRADLTLQPLRWALLTRPRWIALEQVPAVRKLWRAMEPVLQARGYSTWSGNLQAEEYGVPQSRKRAVLIASLDHEVGEPAPTHTRYQRTAEDRGRTPPEGSGLLPWRSMADELGWGMPDRPMYTVPVGSKNGSCGREFGGSSVRKDLDERAASGDPTRWVEPECPLDPRTMPSTTITGSASAYWFGVDQKVRVTVEQAAALQTFPPDWPWQGTKTAKYRQVGNAIPPRLAEAVLREAMNLHQESTDV